MSKRENATDWAADCLCASNAQKQHKRMKKHLLFALLFSLTSLLAFAQQHSEDLIAVKIKNASLWPKKVSLISYQPGETGNGTQIFLLTPGFGKKFRFKEGTKIYIANPDQVGTVMGGNRIDGEKPFLIVQKTDAGKVFKL